MSCADVQTIQAGNGSKTQFSFDFPYLFKSEIEVSFWNATTKEWDVKATTDATYPWQVTDANPTIVEFTSTAPPSPATPVDPNESSVDNVRIRRTTSIDDIRALFNPGSAIRSDDLNKNFEQLRYAIQEANCQGVTDEVYQYLLDNYWDRFDNTLYSADTWRSDDATIATTAALDQRFQDEVNDTLTKAELAAASDVMPDDDVAVPTTGATKNYIDHVIETDILVDGTGLNKSGSGGQVTIGISAGSVDLDRIKAEDIITSAEANPNNDTTIATTAKIDDMIDAAITSDIGTDGTGITVTDDGDGTITLGIAANSVDFDRIKNSDIITRAEQDAGTAEADTNIFTALAAAKRFDTLVQTSNPGLDGDWEVGKTWLQNDSNRALSIWNGSSWLTVSEGGGFVSQPNVVYVDKAAGDDAATGNRISTPKETIKAAIEQINSNIEIDVTATGFNGGSGYVNGTYSNVSLTHSSGTGIGTGLQATITVSGGAVTAISLSAAQQTTLEEYSIGDVLTASNADLGGSGSGLLIPITGEGDGQIVVVAAGVYQEIAPIQIKRRNVSIIGQALRSCIVHPTVATENNILFELNSGSYISNLTLTGMQAGTGTGNTLDATLPTTQGWNFGFYNGAFIVKSPYIQNCTNFSDSEIDNSDLRAHRPRGGAAGDTDSAPTGGGLLVNGAAVASDSPLRSMVADSYTHVALNGPGILVTNNGYTQITSSYAFFNRYHIKTLNGGQANLAASTTDFGDQALVADGRSTTAIFTAALSTAAGDGDTTFTIDEPTADASWHGTATRPQGNMLVELNSITYPVLSAVANGSGWDVTISRPDPANRSSNLGLNGAVATPATASFFLRSQVASSGHTMEYVGSGTNYNALPENGGVPDDTQQVVELNNGKIWTATTDHNGKFTVGPLEVDQRTGAITIAAGATVTNVVDDPTPQLGGDLDANGNDIILATGTAAEPSLRITGDADTGVFSPGANTFAITTGGAEQLRIDSNGTVTIGTDSPRTVRPYGTSNFASTSPITVETANADGAQLLLCANESTNGGDNTAGLILARTRGSNVGDNTIVNNGDFVGTISFAAADGVDILSRTATIHSIVTAIPGENDTPGNLIFSTTSVGDNQPDERVRIDSSGRMLVGQTAVLSNASDQIIESTGDIVVNSATTGSGQTASLNLYHLVSDSAATRPGGRISSVAEDVYTAGSAATSDSALTFSTTLNASLSERVRIDSSGRLLVGTSSSPSAGDGQFSIQVIQGYAGVPAGQGLMSIQRGETAPNITSNETIGVISFNDSDGYVFGQIYCQADANAGASDFPGRLVFSTTADGASSPTERMKITSTGTTLFGTTETISTAGADVYAGLISSTRSASTPLYVNRLSNDGVLIDLRQDTNSEGTISVSGTTVSYNGAHLSRWSQLPGGVERTEILRGSVLSNIDEMCEWGDEENEQLNRMKVSDVEGDRNVAGVFQAWDDDDDTYTNDFYCAMTGDFVIRIAQGVTVERGDLLMSAGDGTAKPQDDDIIRSKTIAKVTSTHVSETYSDGSYCVPCVLMAC